MKRAGGGKFAIICVDPAKHRSEWMMADYFGNLLIQPQTLEHQAIFFKLAMTQVREAQERHGIQDTIVVLERTGNYHLIPKRAFAKAGFETRIVHPFATKQFRMPAETMVRCRPTTIDKVLAWASQTAIGSIENGALHHAIWTDLEQLYQHCRDRSAALEREMVSDLVRSPYVRLLALPAINAVSAAELAGTMGLITRYANANLGGQWHFCLRVHGALLDHHRLIRQFGADPLTCLARRDHQHDREDPHRADRPTDPSSTNNQPPTSSARNVRDQNIFYSSLAIPMAVPSSTWVLPKSASVGQTPAT